MISLYVENKIDNVTLSELSFKLAKANYGETVKIFINSPGGSVDSLRVIKDIILAQCLRIHTVCIGQAASSALTLFMLGDIREMFEGSFFLTHECTVNSGNNVRVNFHDMTQGLFRMQTFRDFSDKDLLMKTKISKEMLYEKIHDTDWVILKDEAIELGIITVY